MSRRVASKPTGKQLDALRVSFQQKQKTEKPFCEFIEQPASKSLRFRYPCEGRTAGAIPGVNSKADRKTCPAIRINNYEGKAIVLASCISAEAPHFVHPNNLVGPECKHGVLLLNLNVTKEDNVVRFEHLGIQCVRKVDVEKTLEGRRAHKVDPYKAGFMHAQNTRLIELNTLRLCVQTFIATGYYESTTNKPIMNELPPIMSNILYDKKSNFDLTMIDVSDVRGPSTGGQKLIILCEKVLKDDIAVRFYERTDSSDTDVDQRRAAPSKKQSSWEAIADLQPSNVFRQVALVIRTPAHRPTNSVTGPVTVLMQLYRPSDGATSAPQEFTYLPSPRPTSVHQNKRKRRKLLRSSEMFNKPSGCKNCQDKPSTTGADAWMDATADRLNEMCSLEEKDGNEGGDFWSANGTGDGGSDEYESHEIIENIQADPAAQLSAAATAPCPVKRLEMPVLDINSGDLDLVCHQDAGSDGIESLLPMLLSAAEPITLQPAPMPTDTGNPFETQTPAVAVAVIDNSTYTYARPTQYIYQQQKDYQQRQQQKKHSIRSTQQQSQGNLEFKENVSPELIFGNQMQQPQMQPQQEIFQIIPPIKQNQQHLQQRQPLQQSLQQQLQPQQHQSLMLQQQQPMQRQSLQQQSIKQNQILQQQRQPLQQLPIQSHQQLQQQPIQQHQLLQQQPIQQNQQQQEQPIHQHQLLQQQPIQQHHPLQPQKHLLHQQHQQPMQHQIVQQSQPLHQQKYQQPLQQQMLQPQQQQYQQSLQSYDLQPQNEMFELADSHPNQIDQPTFASTNPFHESNMFQSTQNQQQSCQTQLYQQFQQFQPQNQQHQQQQAQYPHQYVINTFVCNNNSPKVLATAQGI